ncbi:MerR family transcriptional regulator [Sphingomonas parva]|uniref:MerR family transcriptional regulator n=1 Tax=Sphingomonas parva TaxID=2555898 RepID=A0A4Y8ZT04_9SPHN|nr:helix-turn-helix domain-containing protein [Sphingomonas parva]TFI58422.1 MerR family transcriptional regulator [Sphingomonas parva]
MANVLMIGDLARRTGTKVNTIRFYEDIGLMPAAARTASGRRTYRESDLKRLTFIRHGRALGFSTDEIRSLMELADQPDRDCGEAGAIARRHLVDIEERIAQLELLRDELNKVAKSCAGGKASRCEVIELIADWNHAGETGSSRKQT